jgi:hypothetical protein
MEIPASPVICSALEFADTFLLHCVEAWLIIGNSSCRVGLIGSVAEEDSCTY